VAGITLWHVPISHYAEKARWALDYKQVPHTRRWLHSGTHPAGTFVLTRGRHDTVPVMTVDGRAIGDSTEVIAELERRFPDPPLYPADPAERARALALEEFFDEELGPYIRRWAYHLLTRDPDAVVELAMKQMPWLRPRMAGLTTPMLTAFLDLRFKTGSEDGARVAEEKSMAAIDRLEAELGGREFLCGDAFSVADLTAASLLYPIALPPEGPWQPRNLPAYWRERADAVSDRPGVRWVTETYARRRVPATTCQANRNWTGSRAQSAHSGVPGNRSGSSAIQTFAG
jgi:glutathione S-transferase